MTNSNDWTAIDYAKWANVLVDYDEFQSYVDDGNEMETGLIIKRINGVHYLYNNAKKITAWTLSTWIGRTVIAAVCLESEKWPHGWMVDPRSGVVDLLGSGELVVTIKENETLADAVLAAVRGGGQ